MTSIRINCGYAQLVSNGLSAPAIYLRLSTPGLKTGRVPSPRFELYPSSAMY